MDHEKVLGEHKFPTYEELKNGLLRLIDEGKISREDAARLLPELRESEEERIREDIIGGLMWQRDNLKSEGPHDNNLILPGFCFTVGKHLSYLEKQKENPKNADSIPADCASSVKCEDRWHKTANSLPDNGRDVLAKDALGNYLLASFDGAQWFVSVYDGEDHPVLHTPPILEWCDIPSEKQKEQMLKEAVEGFIICYNDDTYAVESCCLDNKEHHHHSGDKVRIIIVKEDEK